MEADEAPKEPADLIARVTASIKQKQQAEHEAEAAGRSSKRDALIARVLESAIKGVVALF